MFEIGLKDNCISW